MIEQSTPTAARTAWSVEMFEQFWANPDPKLVPAALTDDIIGYWAGREQPVHGKEAYTGCLAALLETLPGLYITVAEHASSGEFTFIRWIMHDSGEHGPFEFTGIDRVRTRDGLVAENRVVCDTAAFKAQSGKEIPGSRKARAAVAVHRRRRTLSTLHLAHRSDIRTMHTSERVGIHAW